MCAPKTSNDLGWHGQLTLQLSLPLSERDLVHVTNPQPLFQAHPIPNLVPMYANIHVL